MIMMMSELRLRSVSVTVGVAVAGLVSGGAVAVGRRGGCVLDAGTLQTADVQLAHRQHGRDHAMNDEALKSDVQAGQIHKRLARSHRS
jgi:hypothetical protein